MGTRNIMVSSIFLLLLAGAAKATVTHGPQHTSPHFTAFSSAPTTPTTTAGSATTGPLHGPIFKLIFKMFETYSPELGDSNSYEFQTLALQVVAAVDQVYSAKYKNLYRKSIVQSFTQGSVVVEANLLFAPNAMVTTSDLTQTMVDAASQPTFGLQVDTTSIVVTDAEISTTPPVTTPVSVTSSTGVTTPGTTMEPKVMLKFSMDQEYKPELADKNSEEFKKLAKEVTGALDKIYTDKYGDKYNSSIINSFSQGSIVVDAELIFNNVSVVTPDVVAEVLVVAAATDNFTLPVNTTTVAVTIETPTVAPITVETSTAMITESATTIQSTTTMATTSQSTTAATTPLTIDRLELNFKIQQPFTSGLSNPTSQEFKDLSDTVTTELNNVYSSKYGSRYLAARVNSFSEGSVVVNAEVSFRGKSPDPGEVGGTLSNAVSNGAVSLPIIPSSISASRPAGLMSTTPHSGFSSMRPTSGATAAVTTSVASTLSQSTTTMALTTTMSTDPPTSSEGTLGLRFTLTDTFNPEYADNTSDAYNTFASGVVSEVNKACEPLFSSFKRSRVNSFAEGSVRTEMTLIFDSQQTVPDTTLATVTIGVALQGTSLNLVPGTVDAFSMVESRSDPHASSLSCTVLSLLLLLATNWLINN